MTIEIIVAYIDRVPETAGLQPRDADAGAAHVVWNARLQPAGDFWRSSATALKAIDERHPEATRIRCYARYSVDDEFPARGGGAAVKSDGKVGSASLGRSVTARA